MKLPEKQVDPTAYVLGILLGFAVLIVAGPLITLWSLNTLFSLNIEYNIATWFASLWIGIMLMRVTTVNKK